MREILIFSTADWSNPFWTNKQHMATCFAKNGWKVLYIDSLGLRKPTLAKNDLSRIKTRLKKIFSIARNVAPNVWCASPAALPFHNSKIARSINTVLLRASILLHMKTCGIKHPLIWTYNPVIADLCAQLPNCGIVYHCVDDLRAAPRIEAQAIEEGEKRLSNIAKLCFTTSPLLQARMKGLFKQSFYEPNVCDYTLFSSARHREEPKDLANIPHPRLLFVGALSDYKVDFALIQKVARQLPNYHWVLIGPVGEGQPGTQKPPTEANIHLLGPRPYHDIPNYMAHCDVAVLPAPHNDYTAAMFPMKFFEYLASGLPVVSTNLPALQEFANLCFLADGAGAFAETLTRVINGERREAKAIQAACQHHSWQSRFKRMEEQLELQLSKR
jgi:glycosyltransferase involved in cell wall biosynthesis